MHQIDMHLDVISPYAYLAFEALPQALVGLSVSVRYKPVLFGGLLKHHGQLGPAEIEPKKRWTFQQVNWLARSQSLHLQPPSLHPFNPLALLRLMLALGSGDGTCNRFITESVLKHVWAQPQPLDASAPERVAQLAQTLLQNMGRDAGATAVADALGSESAKAQLRTNTEQAIALGLFGVPSFVVAGDVFWGLDSLPMLRAKLLGDSWFTSPKWQDAAPAQGISRTGKSPIG